MPTRAPTPCRHPGCGAVLGTPGYCDAHRLAARGQAGESDMTAVLTEFINTTVVVPTATPLTPETDQLQPVQALVLNCPA